MRLALGAQVRTAARGSVRDERGGREGYRFAALAWWDALGEWPERHRRHGGRERRLRGRRGLGAAYRLFPRLLGKRSAAETETHGGRLLMSCCLCGFNRRGAAQAERSYLGGAQT